MGFQDLDKQEITQRFVRYASICTQSEEGVEDTPSTGIQRELAKLLTEELRQMGAAEVVYDEEKCYVYATVPGNLPCDAQKLAARGDVQKKRRENLAPILGLVAHMDTSNAVSATAVHPRVIENYDGGRIVLDAEGRYVSDPEKGMEDLKDQIGNTLVVTDGTSVLGGDDKAGVTQIMEVVRFYLAHPEFPHPTIRVMFTPDEEVGNGTLNADLEQFAVDYAYTVDGSTVGGLEYENFNAATAELTFHGISTHPGDAKGKMRNALLMAVDFQNLMPQKETPFHTAGYQGFYHLEELSGSCEEAKAVYIIRDHDREKFEQRKDYVRQVARRLEETYGEGSVTLKLGDSYYNMREKIWPHRHLIDLAIAAMKKSGVEPRISPIRGGTDGAMLSFRGIPCPNLGTGAYHYHSRYEYVSVDEMEKGVEVLVRLLGAYAAYELDAEE